MQLQNKNKLERGLGLNPVILPTSPEYQNSKASESFEKSDGICWLEALPNMAWVGDASGAIAYLNPQWYNFTGSKGSSSLDENFWQAIHPEDRLLTQQKWGKAVLEGQTYQVKCRLRDLAGAYYWFIGQAQPVSLSRGKKPKWVGTYTQTNTQPVTTPSIASENTARDKALLETKLKEMQGLLKQRSQEFEEFTYIASHDLKSPLRAISNLAEWLEEDTLDLLPVENQHQLKILRRRVRRMELMLEGLLEYSRVGKTQDQLELVDVSALISEVIDTLEVPPQFSIEWARQMPTFRTKKAPLAQVFTHSIDNAIKHHPRYDGNVYISVKDLGKFYEFGVMDDGAGISLTNCDRIFTLFQTVSSRDTLETAGMGLAIVKKILENQGCEITLESQIDRGSVFRFTWSKYPNYSESN
jgi:PAS domain S-box-containing protein